MPYPDYAGMPRNSHDRPCLFQQNWSDEMMPSFRSASIVATPSFCKLRMGAKQIVLVGDHCQLGPVSALFWGYLRAMSHVLPLQNSGHHVQESRKGLTIEEGLFQTIL